MATKSTTKHETVREQAVAAMLALAAERGWAGVTLRGVAAAAGLSLAQLRAEYDGRHDLLSGWSRQIDAQVLALKGGGAARDRLFDLLMERFEVLNGNRAGTLAVLRGLRTDPVSAASGLKALRRSMGWMLEGAGIDHGGAKGALRTAALAGLYLRTLRVWCADDSADMAATMAALDANLSRAEGWAARFGLGGQQDEVDDV